MPDGRGNVAIAVGFGFLIPYVLGIAIGFAGGIGENSPSTRAAVVAGLTDLGIALDAEKNAAPAGGERAIHAASSRVAIWVIPTNEELIVARQARDLLAADGATANEEGA